MKFNRFVTHSAIFLVFFHSACKEEVSGKFICWVYNLMKH
jgi:hypothetical protein